MGYRWSFVFLAILGFGIFAYNIFSYEDEVVRYSQIYVATDYSLVIAEETVIEEADKININLAGIEYLQLIPQVGEATALKIIEYRETVSLFYNIEDIMNVSGIGELTFEKMRDYICVQ